MARRENRDPEKGSATPVGRQLAGREFQKKKEDRGEQDEEKHHEHPGQSKGQASHSNSNKTPLGASLTERIMRQCRRGRCQ